jgi:hypothetical protein
MKQNKIRIVEWFGILFEVIGIVLLFVSIWSSGWNILRIGLTAVLFWLWSKGCFEVAKNKRVER